MLRIPNVVRKKTMIKVVCKVSLSPRKFCTKIMYVRQIDVFQITDRLGVVVYLAPIYVCDLNSIRINKDLCGISVQYIQI